MMLQRDPRLRKEVQEWGCYLMAILYLVNKYTNLPISPEFINQLFDKLVYHEWISDNCRILDPEKIFIYLGLNVHYHDRHDPPEYKCKYNEVEILKYRYNGVEHFVVGDGKGNVAYDPWGCSKTVAKGRLESKRIFTLIGKEAC